MDKRHEQWIDYIKVMACILVVLGHFFQSMVRSNIIDASKLYIWFNQTIYFFHVRLFFVCSGYLYQKRESFAFFSTERLSFIKRKFISLMIPYISFSCLMFLGRNLLASSVNIKNTNLLYSIFISPTAPYWYLIALFFIFLIIPLIKTKSYVLLLILISTIPTILSYFGLAISVPSISLTINNIMWFILGMLICYYSQCFHNSICKTIGYICITVFTIMSLFVFIPYIHINSYALSIIMGLLATTGFVLIEYNYSKEHTWKKMIVERIYPYILPIFLTHTIFAGTTRVLLLKIGIHNFTIHCICGISASILGPVLYMKMSDIKHMRFLKYLIYPSIIINKNNK